MTIAVGMLANGGIVLAADTEQSWGLLKTGRRKVRSAMHNGGMVVAGSGSQGYIEQ
jgi:20S proteasome alpha/beta subunit